MRKWITSDIRFYVSVCCAIWWHGIAPPRSQPKYPEKTTDKTTGQALGRKKT